MKNKSVLVGLILCFAIIFLGGCGKNDTFVSDEIVVPAVSNGTAEVIDMYETSTPDYFYTTDADGNMVQQYVGESYDYHISYEFPDGLSDSRSVSIIDYRTCRIGDIIKASHKALHEITYKDKHNKECSYRSFKGIPKDIKKGDKYRAWIHK